MTVTQLEASVASAPPPGTTQGRLSSAFKILFVFYLLAIVAFCLIQRKTLFSWPTGIVTGNLIASAIWAPIAVIHLDRLARLHHRQHMLFVHQHQESVKKQMADNHREHMAAISAITVPAGDRSSDATRL
jgi:hypothetical protein